SDIESGRLRAEEQEYDTREMLRSVIKKIKSRCDDKGLTFEIKTDETLPAKMYGDTGKLAQILINLLTNAVKYTEVGGIVFSVSVLERENLLCKLRVSVADTGNGIKSDEIGKIFKAYESLDEKKDARRGIGLGLDISRRFAELMGGTLTCESEYGKGSEFVLTITQKVTDRTPVGDISAEEKPAERVRYVPQFIAPDVDVLVVDSSARSVEIIRKLLRETNVFVSSAPRIADGLEKIKDTRFNVMLIDRMLLDTDEDEIIGKIRETDPLLPVYIMTSSGDSGETDYASKGYTGYITKPVDGVLLETIIFKHIPEQMRQVPDIAGETNVLPSELEWLYETEGISAADGIRNSGGVTVFIAALEMFRETIDANINILRELYGKGSIKRLTVRLHLLKSSSGMIGAGELSALAGELENAGKKSDRKFIDNNIGRLFGEYGSFKDKLAPIQSQKSSQ
ncbi:MAG: response regulator, partial [Ruminococcus sp.]|nr:response regulator [Ruminococcus sp.]